MPGVVRLSEPNLVSEFTQMFRRFLFLNEQNDIATTMTNIQGMLSFMENVFSSSSVAAGYVYFCINGASTCFVLQNELGMPEATSYRVVKRLRNIGLLMPATRVSKVLTKRGGPRPTVWALEGSSTEEIAKALRLHYRMLSPKYRVAEEIAQTIMQEYLVPRNLEEVPIREIKAKAQEMKIPAREHYDVVNLAAEYLRDKGIKVWR